MFTVQYFNDATSNDAIAFTGTLDDCRAYIADVIADYDNGDDLYIVAPDGFTVVD